MTTAIVQARMTSQRWPRKVMVPVFGMEMVYRVLDAALSAVTVKRVVLTVPSDEPEWAAIEDRIWWWGIRLHRGHPTNVLRRVQEASEVAETVVRLTGDCPFLPAALIDLAVMTYRAGDGGLVYTHHDRHPSYWPDGMDVEVFSGAALRKLTGDDEHVTTELYPGHPVPIVGGRMVGKLSLDHPLELAGMLCPLCARGVPHHTNSDTSIGGADRHVIWDVHAVKDNSGVGLAECLAYNAVWSRL